MKWAADWQALETKANPFAVVVLAELKTRETQKDPLARKQWKFRIVRSLYERGVAAGLPATDGRDVIVGIHAVSSMGAARVPGAVLRVGVCRRVRGKAGPGPQLAMLFDQSTCAS